MSMIALTEAAEISEAYALLKRSVQENGVPHERLVTRPGSAESKTVTLYWHEKEQLWTLAEEADEGYWFAFGSNNPAELKEVAPVVEVSLVRDGVSKLKPGRFVRDESSGWVFVGHSGKVGGGKPGAGQAAFLDFFGEENLTPVVWPGGVKTKLALLGALNDHDILLRIAGFVRQVEVFKAGAGTK